MAAKTLLSLAAAAPRRLSAAVLRPSSTPLLRRLPLPLLAAPSAYFARLSAIPPTRCFSSRPTTSSLNDPSPNWSNRPPKETILLDGCDFEHWLIVMEPPEPEKTRDEIIDSYIKTLMEVVGSEEEARKSIYSVSTKHYFAFGCKVSEELSYKIKTLPKVRWVLPDSYLDVKNKDYGGEPFIDGQAVPYDPKYHEEWVRNNARAMERNRRNDRPRNFDRSRNFERRRENVQNFQNRDAPMQSQGFQNRDPQGAMPPQGAVPPMQSQGFQNRDPQGAMPPQGVPPQGMPPQGVPPQGMPPQGAVPPQVPQGQPSNLSPPQNVHAGSPGGVPNYQNQMPNVQRGFMPNAGPGYQGSAQAYQGGGAPGAAAPSGPGYQGNTQQYQGGNTGYQGNAPAYQGGSQGYQGPNAGHQGNPAGYSQQGGQSGYQGGPGANYNQQGGQSGYQGGAPNYQGGNQSGGYQGAGGYQSSGYQGGNPSYQQPSSFQGRDIPGRDQ